MIAMRSSKILNATASGSDDLSRLLGIAEALVGESQAPRIDLEAALAFRRFKPAKVAFRAPQFASLSCRSPQALPGPLRCPVAFAQPDWSSSPRCQKSAS